MIPPPEADGLSVWWDAHITGGDKWRDAIAAQLDDARCVLVVWSKRSVGSEGHFVREEAARAEEDVLAERRRPGPRELRVVRPVERGEAEDNPGRPERDEQLLGAARECDAQRNRRRDPGR